MTTESNSRPTVQNVNRFRRDLGLPPIVLKERKCLRCGCMFHSQGAHNRLCDSCAQANSKVSIVFEGFSGGG